MSDVEWHSVALAPIVLVHGFTQTGASWRTVAEGLDGHEVVAPDLPGHGANASAVAAPAR